MKWKQTCRRRSKVWFPNLLERTEEMNARYKNPDNDPRGVWKATDSTAQGGHGTTSQFYTLTAPNGKQHNLTPGRCWVYTEKVMQQMIADNRVWFGPDGNNFPALKRFLTEVKQGTACKTIWGYGEVGHNQEGKKEIKDLFDAVPFDTPKPTRLLKRIVKIATNPDDIILDFFSGSATLADAVMQLNAEDSGLRRFIMVQLPESCENASEAYQAGYKNLCEIGKERIRRAGKKLTETDGQMQIGDSEKKPLDVGFRVFKLDSSNLQTWDATPVDELRMEDLLNRMNTMINRVKADRSDLDMVYEVMLKLGVPLTYPVKKIQLKSNKEQLTDRAAEKTVTCNLLPVTCYTVGEDCLLLVCLAADITPEDVEAMADYVPAKVIISRDSFDSDTAMANAYYILRDRGIELKLL